MMRRRPLLRAAALGGAGYLAGKSAAKQNQQAAQATIPGGAPAPTGFPTPPSTPPQPEIPGGLPPAAVASGPASAADRLTQLKQLGELRQADVLTEEEFQKEKQHILGSRMP